ncbi:hypothetical protein D3C75_1303120 [compost metagenome]
MQPAGNAHTRNVDIQLQAAILLALFTHPFGQLRHFFLLLLPVNLTKSSVR